MSPTENERDVSEQCDLRPWVPTCISRTVPVLQVGPRNRKRPTCVLKYECSSSSSGVSFTTLSFTPAVAHTRVELVCLEPRTMSAISCGLSRSQSCPASKPETSLAICQGPQTARLQEHGTSHVFGQLFHSGQKTHDHVVVHVSHRPQVLTHVPVHARG